ncbi:uncharacterized protein CEXT_553381 [Caerostris extrusa]|uniref:Uncharacterized protein n=1 Tax=Caerostris extrusa TaxID=172846 RepID=A0AAV4XRR0_CAEEX|nr:uncharacterized protein CEXT_553381 [Caerostris extrusa]
MLRPILRRVITGKQALRRNYAAAAQEAVKEPDQEKNEKKSVNAGETNSFVMSVFKGQLKTEQVFPYPDVLTPMKNPH